MSAFDGNRHEAGPRCRVVAPAALPFSTDLSAQPSRQSAAPPHLTVPDTLDAWIRREMERRHIPGLALAIVRAGEVVTTRAYGFADLQNQVPVNTATRFELASLTKAFTAAGIMLLVEDGKVDLDAPISEYLSDAPANWAGVTTRHLLYHTSGLPRIGEAFRSRTIPWPLDMSTKVVYEAARGDTLSSRPGATHTYSDVGYVLLGMITEKASGTPWRDFVRSRILEPLGMKDSYVMDLEHIHRNEARGYTLRRGEVVNIRRVYQVELPSHAGIFSNLTDLTKWDAALYDNRLLREASLTSTWTPARLIDGNVFPYGAGWFVSCQAGRPVHQHTGLTGTEMVRFPADTLTVIVLTNLGGPSPEVDSWNLAPRIAEMMLPTLAVIRTPRALPNAVRDRVVGEYRLVTGGRRPNSAVRIGVDGGRMYFEMGGDRSPFTYLGNDTFMIDGEPGAVVLERGAAGRVDGWRVHGPETAPTDGAVRTRADCASVPAVGPLVARAVRVSK
ncbi:MAG TPA: serine hydrolase domain-containing protein [Gemmatimonas sp.]|nr:serine hydrolase domain-containing protein [Gemmatimonas sp.]